MQYVVDAKNESSETSAIQESLQIEEIRKSVEMAT